VRISLKSVRIYISALCPSLPKKQAFFPLQILLLYCKYSFMRGYILAIYYTSALSAIQSAIIRRRQGQNISGRVQGKFEQEAAQTLKESLQNQDLTGSILRQDDKIVTWA
jgi:hypothetical protein